MPVARREAVEVAGVEVGAQAVDGEHEARVRLADGGGRGGLLDDEGRRRRRRGGGGNIDAAVVSLRAPLAPDDDEDDEEYDDDDDDDDQGNEDEMRRAKTGSAVSSSSFDGAGKRSRAAGGARGGIMRADGGRDGASMAGARRVRPEGRYGTRARVEAIMAPRNGSRRVVECEVQAQGRQFNPIASPAMAPKHIDAKVRPLANNTGLEKASLQGAARVYVTKDAFLALTSSSLESRVCLVEKLAPSSTTIAAANSNHTAGDGDESLPPPPPPPQRREALLCAHPQGMSANVVQMTRAFLDASGFKLGDQVRIVLAENPAAVDAEEVLVEDATPDDDKTTAEARQSPSWKLSWEFSLAVSMNRAEQVFPGMVFEGVNVNKFRRSFKVVSVNAQAGNLARFRLASSAVRIAQPGEQPLLLAADATAPGAAGAPQAGGDLVVTGVPGLTSQVATLNRFLRGFTRPFWVQDERESCGVVIHGGRGTGKTFILRRIEQTGWGRAHWVKPTDKLSTLRETFKQAFAAQPSVIFIDGLDKITAKDRTNRESVIETLAEELDALSAHAHATGSLPRVVVVATCQDWMTDVPEPLQKRSRFRKNIALPIPRAAERLEILRWLDPPLRPADKDSCLLGISQKTHAYNGDDLANLVLNAKEILGTRLDEEQQQQQSVEAQRDDDNTASGKTVLPNGQRPLPLPPQQDEQQQQQQHYLTPDDMEAALRVTRPTAMHDINLKPPTIHWRDVGGQESLKRVLRRMIKNTKNTNPASARVLRHPPKGLLLYGPPGCSKTLSAQAMATESGFNFFAVKGAELLNMYVGESERAVRTLFERARAASPSIIFFDEIDSIGGQRAGGGSSSSAAAASRSTGAVNMLTTLLTEMDGFESLTGVLVLAATNRPEAIDPALLRPGRFDQVLYVGAPDRTAREAVFAVHLRGLALAPDVDVPELARLAEGYSGAEIKAICNEAGLAVLDRFDDEEEGEAETRGDKQRAGAEGEKGGATAKLEIAMADLVDAIDRTPRNITAEMVEGYEDWRRQFKRLT
ncbi:ATPase [Purpureocillium lavendulum]|uniref:ATPase n=1 Tax=Purpureocillium lavendulum TaxID=1247861 RepID=A0AB34G6V0_9HYPO|nr:ATPase [Purpureocillium lavendulum]